MTNQIENFWRFKLTAALLTIVPLVIVGKMVSIQLNPEQAQRFLKESLNWATTLYTVTPARGQIYDRWGSLMAGNQAVYEIGLELKEINDPETIASALSTTLGLDYAYVFALASTPASETVVHLTVVDNIPRGQIENLEAYKEQIDKAYAETGEGKNLNGLYLTPHLARIYPENSLASNLLGFVNREGVGYFGVEGRYNDLLAGKPKQVRVSRDPRVLDRPVVPPGASLVLTIDRTIQRSMEQVLDSEIEKTGSESGTIVVLDPKTGEILAIATTPRMNLNEFWNINEVFKGETPYNRAVGQIYEPGSVFKVLTMASALDAGVVTESTEFIDTGVIEVGGTLIHNWDMGAWGPQSMQGCMQHSLNVCLSWVATQLGAEQFYRYLRAFGIGRPTGIDLAGEAAGKLKVPGDGDWFPNELATNSYGQGVAVTPLQLAVAISAVANDGKIMAPHVVRSIADGNYQRDVDQYLVSIPIKAETARQLSELLARSLETESSDALVTGYRVAGKTGTADIPMPFGYTSNQTNASFVGWGPVDDPRFLVYVWLEKPATSPWGSVVAAPVFRRAVEKLVVLLKLPPDAIRLQLNGQ